MADSITKKELEGALEKIKVQYTIDIRDAIEHLVSVSDLRNKLDALKESISDSLATDIIESKVDSLGNKIKNIENLIQVNDGEYSRSAVELKNSISEAVAKITADYTSKIAKATANLMLKSDAEKAIAMLEAKIESGETESQAILQLRSELNRAKADLNAKITNGIVTARAGLALEADLEKAQATLDAAFESDGTFKNATIKAFANKDFSSITLNADQIAAIAKEMTLSADNIDFNATKEINITSDLIKIAAKTILINDVTLPTYISQFYNGSEITGKIAGGIDGTLSVADGTVLTWTGGVLTGAS